MDRIPVSFETLHSVDRHQPSIWSYASRLNVELLAQQDSVFAKTDSEVEDGAWPYAQGFSNHRRHVLYVRCRHCVYLIPNASNWRIEFLKEGRTCSVSVVLTS